MNQMNTLFVEEIRRHRVIAILRHLPDEQVEPVFDSLTDAGIRLIEITMNTTGAAAQISRLVRLYGEKLLIGAGTVSTPARAREALTAGARFLVTPNLDLDVIELAKAHPCPVVPGVLTPTEMMTAVRAGAAALKLFPAGQMGMAYLRDVLAPLDDLKIVAVGGVTAETAGDWIKAGCIGVGLGSSLIDKSLLRDRQYTEIKRQTRLLIEQLRSC